MLTSVHGVYREGKIELEELPENMHDGTRVIVTFLQPTPIDLRTLDSERTPEPETLRTEYEEVCKSHNGITEFRAKLLALLPLASGAGIFLLLRDQNGLLETTHLPAIGLFGFFITLGLFLHELRGMRRCWELIELGKSLEEQLELHQAQFIKEYSYYESGFRVVGTDAASWVIYLIVLLAWLYVAAARFL